MQPGYSLRQAVMAGDWKTSMQRLREGADPNEQDDYGCSVFLSYCANAHRWSSDQLLEGLRCFMAHGADPSLPQAQGFTAWHSLLARCPDLFEVWLPEVLRHEGDIDAWFTVPPPMGGRELDPLYSFMPFACRARFDHSLPALRAMMQEKLLHQQVPLSVSVRSPRRI